MDAFLRLCYPVEHPEILDSDLFLAVLSAAHKYHATKTMQVLRQSNAWSVFSQKAPFRFYFAAFECGWREEAEACARALDTNVVPTLYIPEMENISSMPYHSLLAFVGGIHASATTHFTLTGLPGRHDQGVFASVEGERDACTTLFPTTLSTAEPPPWLAPHIHDIRSTLEKSVGWSNISNDLRLAHTFIAAAAAVPFRCAASPSHTKANSSTDATRAKKTGSGAPEGSTSGASIPVASTIGDGRQCSKDDNIDWAIAFLRAYEDAVKAAVSSVRPNV